MILKLYLNHCSPPPPLPPPPPPPAPLLFLNHLIWKIKLHELYVNVITLNYAYCTDHILTNRLYMSNHLKMYC